MLEIRSTESPFAAEVMPAETGWNGSGAASEGKFSMEERNIGRKGKKGTHLYDPKESEDDDHDGDDRTSIIPRPWEAPGRSPLAARRFDWRPRAPSAMLCLPFSRAHLTRKEQRRGRKN